MHFDVVKRIDLIFHIKIEAMINAMILVGRVVVIDE